VDLELNPLSRKNKKIVDTALKICYTIITKKKEREE